MDNRFDLNDFSGLDYLGDLSTKSSSVRPNHPVPSVPVAHLPTQASAPPSFEDRDIKVYDDELLAELEEKLETEEAIIKAEINELETAINGLDSTQEGAILLRELNQRLSELKTILAQMSRMLLSLSRILFQIPSDLM